MGAMEEKRYKRPRGQTPQICTAFWNASLELVRILSSFARSAIALLAADNGGGEFVPDSSLHSEQAQLQARAYFGFWFRLYGKRLLEEDDFFQVAADFGNVRFSDVIMYNIGESRQASE